MRGLGASAVYRRGSLAECSLTHKANWALVSFPETRAVMTEYASSSWATISHPFFCCGHTCQRRLSSVGQVQTQEGSDPEDRAVHCSAARVWFYYNNRITEGQLPRRLTAGTLDSGRKTSGGRPWGQRACSHFGLRCRPQENWLLIKVVGTECFLRTSCGVPRHRGWNYY